MDDKSRKCVCDWRVRWCNDSGATLMYEPDETQTLMETCVNQCEASRCEELVERGVFQDSVGDGGHRSGVMILGM